MPANKPSNKPVSSCVNSAGRNDRLLAETNWLQAFLPTVNAQLRIWKPMAEYGRTDRIAYLADSKVSNEPGLYLEGRFGIRIWKSHAGGREGCDL